MPDNEYRAAGRVLGSQIYVAESAEKIVHDVPFSARDIFINSTNGNIYQYDGAEWVYCYTIGAGTIGNVVRYVTSDSEALVFDVNTLVVVTPVSGTPRLTRVASDSFGAKTLETVGLGDGALPYITKAVNDLLNYYNKSEVDAKIAAIHTIEFLVVDELPLVGQSNVIYLVPHTHGVADLYDEYCWVASESKYEKIGNTDALVNYYDKDETNALLATKQNALTFDNEPTAGSNNPVTSEGIKNAIDASASRVYRYKGSLPYYANLPVSGNVTGDVYNIENADPSHGVKAGDNVAWNGLAWDVLAGVVDLTNYYTKPEVDAAVAPKANSADVYTKLEANALLAEKADKATTYTKTETDALLAPKANSADVNADLATKADKATTYTKTETDALLAPKATTADVNAGLALKADKATTYTKTEDDALLAGKADKSTTYTKTEVDTIASTKADGNNVYTKAQSDTLLAGKANGSDVYTKAEVGALLEPKANSADVYSKSETYSKEQVDAIASDKVDKVSGKQLSTEDYTSAEKAKLQGIEAGAQVNDVTSVAGKTGDVALTKSDVGLGNVENTSDAQKPVSAAQQAALDLKANKSETYTKSETNALLSPKADRAELGTAASKNVGTASGNVPIIGADGKLDPTVMPAIAMSDTYVVSSQADMLALTARVGDVCVRTDENKTYILKETGADTLSHWQELLVPTADILNMLIEPFLTTEAYGKGDYVVYSNVLYRFTADKAAGAWDSTKVETATLNDLIDDVNQAVADVAHKANIDDYYGGMGAGYADVAATLQSNRVIEDADVSCPPITFGTTGGEAEIKTGYSDFEEMYGNSVKYNQQAKELNATDWDCSGGVDTYSNGKATITWNEQASYWYNHRFTPSDTIDIINGHKYLFVFTITNSYSGKVSAGFGSVMQTSEVSVLANTKTKVSGIVTSVTTDNSRIWMCLDTDKTAVANSTSLVEDVMCFDLTAMDIEATTADEAIAKLLALGFDVNQYLPYNAGDILDATSGELESVGENAWDEVAEVGTINTSTGQNEISSNQIRSKNYTEVLPNTDYFLSCDVSAAAYVYFYDANKNYLGYDDEAHTNKAFTTPENAAYIRFIMDSAYGTTYNNDISIYLEWDTPNRPYVKSKRQVVALPGIPLRSVPNYADPDHPIRDVAKQVGGGKRRVGKYTFTGSESWTSWGAGYYTTITGLNATQHAGNVIPNAISTAGDVITRDDLYAGTKAGVTVYFNNIYVSNNTGLAGKTIIYELAEETDIPTTGEGANPGWEKQLYVDNYGTLRFKVPASYPANTPQVPQPYFVKYTISLTEYLDSSYVRTNGDANNIALQSEVDDIVGGNEAVGKSKLAANIEAKGKIPNSEPYAIRQTPNGVAEDCLVEDIVGYDLAVNQKLKNPTLDSSDNWSVSESNTSLSISNNKANISVTASFTNQWANLRQNLQDAVIAGHYYLVCATKTSTKTRSGASIGITECNIVAYNSYSTANVKQFVYAIVTPVSTSGQQFQVYGFGTDEVQTTDSAIIENPRVIDLTQMFGSNDVVNAVIGSDASTQVAKLLAFLGGRLPKAYNPGSLQCVKTSGRKANGFNQWDEEVELGVINTSTGENQGSSSNLRSKNYMRVLPNTTYYFYNGRYFGGICQYDENKNFISGTWNGTTLSNCAYIRFFLDASYGTTYNHDICINISDPAKNGTYIPHEESTSPCEAIDLHGVLQVVNGKVVANGDVYPSDGKGKRRYAKYICTGNETWFSNGSGSAGDKYYLSNMLSADANAKPDLLSNVIASNGYNGFSDSSGSIYLGSKLGINFDNRASYLTVPSGANPNTVFHAGVEILYELNHDFDTDFEATPFPKTQTAYQGGTEEWLEPELEEGETAPEIMVPVGHDTNYLPDLADKLENSPESPTSDGTYVMTRSGGSNSYTSLATYLANNGYVAQQDLSSGITDVAGLTYNFKKAYKIGKMVFITLQCVNGTGSAISASTHLFTLSSDLKPSTTLDVPFVVENVSAPATLNLETSNGAVRTKTEIASGKYFFIALTYVIS